MARQRIVVSRRRAGMQAACERSGRVGWKTPVHGGDRRLGLPNDRTLRAWPGVGNGKSFRNGVGAPSGGVNAILGQMCTSSEPGCSTATSGAYPDAIEWPTTTTGPLTFSSALSAGRMRSACVVFGSSNGRSGATAL